MPHTKAEIIENLAQIQKNLSQTVQALSPEQFSRQPETEWSAADYFKHLLLSLKPFVKGISLPKEQLSGLFGQADHPSRTYAELVETYNAFLGKGYGAEDYKGVTPVDFRMPEGIADEQTYLLQSWNEAHQRLYATLESWSEADLDQYQLPHPAINLLTMREMLFFTIHHNGIHAADIQRVGG